MLAGPARRRARARRARRSASTHREAADDRLRDDRPDEFALARGRGCACCSRRTRCTRCSGWCRSASWSGSSRRSGDLLDRSSASGPGRDRQLVLEPAPRSAPPRVPPARAGPAHRARLRAARAAGVEHRAPGRVLLPPPPHRHAAPLARRRVAQRGRLRLRRHAHARRDRVPRLPRAWCSWAPRSLITQRRPGDRHVRPLARRRRPLRQLRVGVALHRPRFGVAGAGGARADRRRSARCSSAPPGSRRRSSSSPRCPRRLRRVPARPRAPSGSAVPRSPPGSRTGSTRSPATRSRTDDSARSCCSRCCRSCSLRVVRLGDARATRRRGRGAAPRGRSPRCSARSVPGRSRARSCVAVAARSSSRSRSPGGARTMLACVRHRDRRVARRGGAAVPVAARVRAQRHRQGVARLRVPPRPRPLGGPALRQRARRRPAGRCGGCSWRPRSRCSSPPATAWRGRHAAGCSRSSGGPRCGCRRGLPRHVGARARSGAHPRRARPRGRASGSRVSVFVDGIRTFQLRVAPARRDHRCASRSCCPRSRSPPTSPTAGGTRPDRAGRTTSRSPSELDRARASSACCGPGDPARAPARSRRAARRHRLRAHPQRSRGRDRAVARARARRRPRRRPRDRARARRAHQPARPAARARWVCATSPSQHAGARRWRRRRPASVAAAPGDRRSSSTSRGCAREPGSCSTRTSRGLADPGLGGRAAPTRPGRPAPTRPRRARRPTSAGRCRSPSGATAPPGVVLWGEAYDREWKATAAATHSGTYDVRMGERLPGHERATGVASSSVSSGSAGRCSAVSLADLAVRRVRAGGARGCACRGSRAARQRESA